MIKYFYPSISRLFIMIKTTILFFIEYANPDLFLLFLKELIVICSSSNRVEILELIYLLYAPASELHHGVHHCEIIGYLIE